MTVDAPATVHPMRFAQPVVAALASAGVVTVITQQFFGITQISPGLGPAVLTWLAAITAVVMLVVPAAAVAKRPSLGRAGGWPIVAVGLGAGVLILQAVQGGAVGVAAVLLILAGVGGFAAALGGLTVVAAFATGAERFAVAAGVAFAFAGQRYNQSLFTFGSPGGIFGYLLPVYLVIGLALVASAMAFTRPIPDTPRVGYTAAFPMLIVSVSVLIQLGHFVRRLVVDDMRVGADGLASPLRTNTVGAFSEYSVIGLAVLAGLILVWLGYRRGKADLGRWAALGFALGGPSLMVKSGFYYEHHSQTSLLAVTGLLAAAAGAVLALRADRFFAWDALGAVLAATGMIIAWASYRAEARPSVLATFLITGGFGFALACGLARIVRVTPSTSDKAVSLSLGFVAMLATADAIAPVAWAPIGLPGLRLGAPITSLIGAGVVLALFGFSRAVGRARHEIREQAEEQPRP